MSVRKQSRKIRANSAERIAARIVPAAQAARKDFTVVDVANHTDAEQRHMVRSGEKKTIRKKTHVQILASRRAIDQAHVRVLQWFADQFELGFATVGCTANYLGAGGSGFGSADLLARYKAQAEARDNFYWARESVPPSARKVLERVIIDRGSVGQDTILFRLAVQFLDKAVGHLVVEAE